LEWSAVGDRKQLSHLDAQGRVRMVDVGDKPVTARRAVAEGRVRVSSDLVAAIRDQRVPKGNLLEVARIAGIQAAKATDRLIPLCHSLPIDVVDIDLELGAGAIRIRAEVRTTARTGVEMEALTAVTVAALTVVDMGKAIDRTMIIEQVRLVEKSGGRSGDFQAVDPSSPTEPE
jgi:cyclic pyranopterin phosphate synthase